MFLRKLHLWTGFSLVPLVIIQAVTGLLLRLKVSSALLHTVHTWFKYSYDFTGFARGVGVVLGVLTAVGVFLLSVTGAVIYTNTRIQQWRRRKKRWDAQRA
jgi:uncharacterized iron-regulated membrane protein